MPEACQGGRRI